MLCTLMLQVRLQRVLLYSVHPRIAANGPNVALDKLFGRLTKIGKVMFNVISKKRFYQERYMQTDMLCVRIFKKSYH